MSNQYNVNNSPYVCDYARQSTRDDYNKAYTVGYNLQSYGPPNDSANNSISFNSPSSSNTTYKSK